jgi:hypothetical protein
MNDSDLTGCRCGITAALKSICIGKPDLLVAGLRNEFLYGLRGIGQATRFDGSTHKDHAATATLGK